MAEAASWRASSRYWRKVSVFTLVVGVVVQFFMDVAEFTVVERIAIAVALFGPFVAWAWRLAAWDDGTRLVIRSWFRTKRIAWDQVERLTLVERSWGGPSSWVTGAVRHTGRRGGVRQTYVNCLIAVSDPGLARIADELRTLAERHDLPLDEPPTARFRRRDVIAGRSIWD